MDIHGEATRLSICMQRSAFRSSTIGMVYKANIDLHYRRAALCRALGENILQDVPAQAKLYMLDEYVLDPYPSVRSDLKGWANYGYPWRSDAFVYLYAKKRVQVIDDRNGLRDHVQN